jgi:hypothetical protein
MASYGELRAWRFGIAGIESMLRHRRPPIQTWLVLDVHEAATLLISGRPDWTYLIYDLGMRKEAPVTVHPFNLSCE